MSDLTDVRVSSANFTRQHVETIYASSRVLAMKMALLRQQGRFKKFGRLQSSCDELLALLRDIDEAIKTGRVSTSAVTQLLVKTSQFMGIIFDLFQVANVPREIKHEVAQFRGAMNSAGIHRPIEEMCILEE